MSRTACYLRVSTNEQAREGYSIAAQRDRLLAFAQAQDWSVVERRVSRRPIPVLSGALSNHPMLLVEPA
jgi:DNA invertase Pin-like site-specific DNA recombinase